MNCFQFYLVYHQCIILLCISSYFLLLFHFSAASLSLGEMVLKSFIGTWRHLRGESICYCAWLQAKAHYENFCRRLTKSGQDSGHRLPLDQLQEESKTSSCHLPLATCNTHLAALSQRLQSFHCPRRQKKEQNIQTDGRRVRNGGDGGKSVGQWQL